MVDVTFCNEMFAAEGMSLSDQARTAAELGAMGLELAPATLSDAPHLLEPARIGAIRREIEAEGLRVTGLHWLLSGYPELSITDPVRTQATQEVLVGLIHLCAALGGDVLVHGSPGQRAPTPGDDGAQIETRLAAFFAPIARAAEAAGVTYCIEPLSRAETPVLNTVAQAARLVARIGSPSFVTMIDTSAAGQTEDRPVADLIRYWAPTGRIGHIHLNDTNRGAPGTGEDPFDDILTALRAAGWSRPVGIEPFKIEVSARRTFEIGMGAVRRGWGA